MAKQGRNIYLRKDGRWEGRYLKGKVDGKRQYGYVFGKTYEDAVQKLDAALMLLAGEDSCSETFEALCDEWLSVQSPELKASSIAKYSNVLKSYLLPKFGKEDVSSISRNDVMLFSRELLVSGGVRGKGLAPKTVNSTLSVMKNVFDYVRKEKGLQVPEISDMDLCLYPAMRPAGNSRCVLPQSLHSITLRRYNDFSPSSVSSCLLHVPWIFNFPLQIGHGTDSAPVKIISPSLQSSVPGATIIMA